MQKLSIYPAAEGGGSTDRSQSDQVYTNVAAPNAGLGAVGQPKAGGCPKAEVDQPNAGVLAFEVGRCLNTEVAVD